jgi:hypothetical protein
MQIRHNLFAIEVIVLGSTRNAISINVTRFVSYICSLWSKKIPNLHLFIINCYIIIISKFL